MAKYSWKRDSKDNKFNEEKITQTLRSQQTIVNLAIESGASKEAIYNMAKKVMVNDNLIKCKPKLQDNKFTEENWLSEEKVDLEEEEQRLEEYRQINEKQKLEENRKIEETLLCEKKKVKENQKLHIIEILNRHTKNGVNAEDLINNDFGNEVDKSCKNNCLYGCLYGCMCYSKTDIINLYKNYRKKRDSKGNMAKKVMVNENLIKCKPTIQDNKEISERDQIYYREWTKLNKEQKDGYIGRAKNDVISIIGHTNDISNDLLINIVKISIQIESIRPNCLHGSSLHKYNHKNKIEMLEFEKNMIIHGLTENEIEKNIQYESDQNMKIFLENEKKSDLNNEIKYRYGGKL